MRSFLIICLSLTLQSSPAAGQTTVGTTDLDNATAGLPKVVSGAQQHHVLVPCADHQLFYDTTADFVAEADALLNNEDDVFVIDVEGDATAYPRDWMMLPHIPVIRSAERRWP